MERKRYALRTKLRVGSGAELAHHMLDIDTMRRVMDKAHGTKRARRRAWDQRRVRARVHRAHPRRWIGCPAYRRLSGNRVVSRGSTLLALVQEVQRRASSDAEVVRIVRGLVNSGAVVLTGSFAGRTF